VSQRASSLWVKVWWLVPIVVSCTWAEDVPIVGMRTVRGMGASGASFVLACGSAPPPAHLTQLMPAVTLVFSRQHTLSSGTQCGHKIGPSAHLCQADGSPVLPGSGNSHGAHEAESLVRGPHASQEWRSVLTPCQDTRGAPKTLDVPLEININTKIQSPCPEQTRPLLPCTNMPRRWLVKAEPDPHVVRGVDLGSCPYSRLQESGVCLYDGVRNYQARNGVRRCVVWC
jgi:hypothetical protein